MNIEAVYNPYSREVRLFTEGKEAIVLPSGEEREIGKDDALPNGAKDAFLDYYPNGGMEFEEWAALFFDKLHGKYDRSSYTIKFCGMGRDIEALLLAKNEFAAKHSDIEVELNTEEIMVKNEAMESLKRLFTRMCQTVPQSSAFKDLRQDLSDDGKIKRNFDRATSGDFEIAVVATMSSGKSTLINAMLGQEMLPAANAATTATITRIHNKDGQETFTGEAVDEDGNVVVSNKPFTIEDMKYLNGDGSEDNPPKARYIDIYGDIKGISNSALRLVVIDTPGPNNSQSKEHGETTQKILIADYKPMVLYVLDATHLKVNDDNSLLRDVAQQMNKSGRQSKDRFIFVLNKADAFDPGKGESVERAVESCKEYLAKHGIHDAKIFPCASRMAKVIRQSKAGCEFTKKEKGEMDMNVGLFVEEKAYHFSDMAPVSESVRAKLNKQLQKAQDAGDKEAEVLVYTGIPAVEGAIDEYLTKYAVPSKVQQGVNCFNRRIEALGVAAAAMTELKGNEKAVEERLQLINKIQAVLDNGEKRHEVERELEGINIRDDLNRTLETTMQDAMHQMHDFTNGMGKKVSPEEAKHGITEINKRVQEIQSAVKVAVEKILNDTLASQCQKSVDKYNQYLKNICGGDDAAVPAAALGDLGVMTVEDSLQGFIQDKEEQVKVGSHMERNSERKGWGVFAFWKPWKVSVADYETHKWQEVDFEEFLKGNVATPFRRALAYMMNLAKEKASEQEKLFKDFFSGRLQELERKIQEKLKEQKDAMNDKEKREAMVEASKKDLEWLNGIKAELEELTGDESTRRTA